jgi:hypothetical protein
MSDTKYITVIDGKYFGGSGYIKRPADTPEKYLCIIWMDGQQLEITLHKSQFIPATEK